MASDQDGMSLRDNFAAAALTGIIGGSEMEDCFDAVNSSHVEEGKDHWDVAAQKAYVAADAMLVARVAGNWDRRPAIAALTSVLNLIQTTPVGHLMIADDPNARRIVEVARAVAEGGGA